MTLIVVAHGKGGVGKSTLALNLAIELDADEIIDLDPQNSLYTLYSLREEHKPEKELHISASLSIGDLKGLIERDNINRLTIVDTGGFDSKLNSLVIGSADMVITPVGTSNVELAGLRKFSQRLKTIAENAEIDITAHVVLSRIHPLKTKFESLTQFITNNSNLRLLESKIRERSIFNESTGRCLAAKEYDPKSEAAIEIKALGIEIIDKLKEIEEA